MRKLQEEIQKVGLLALFRTEDSLAKPQVRASREVEEPPRATAMEDGKVQPIGP
jgi:hypothetical protein